MQCAHSATSTETGETVLEITCGAGLFDCVAGWITFLLRSIHCCFLQAHWEFRPETERLIDSQPLLFSHNGQQDSLLLCVEYDANQLKSYGLS